MPKSAAAVASEISDRKTKNKKVAKVDEKHITGGIADELTEEPATFKTGTPFDLVEGRPNVDFWGPLEAYGFVTTPTGEYAIPHGKILRMERRKEWDKKEGMEVVRSYPIYEAAPQELLDYIKTPVEATG